MFLRLKRLILDKRAEFAETAIVLPMLMLGAMGLFDFTMAGFASVNASNAANYGARIGSITQRGAGGAAYAGTLNAIANAEVGDYAVSVSGGGFPGAQITVLIEWEVPNHVGSITTLWGGTGISSLSGTTVSTFRQEGW